LSVLRRLGLAPRGAVRRPRSDRESEVRTIRIPIEMRHRAGMLAFPAAVLLALPALAQEAETHAAAEGSHAPSIMNVEPGLMIWTVVTFVLLLVALRFTAWKPLTASLEARERRIRDAVEGAERARKESEALLARHQQLLDQARGEAQKIIEEGKSDGLKLKHEIAAQARAEAEEFKARARRELELATDQAKKELWVLATQLSTELAERIVKRSLGDADHKRIVDEVLDEYRASSAV
jgi:F-type H+-transporting ATPase subunit b